MKLLCAEANFLDPHKYHGEQVCNVYRRLEKIGRVCYKSEDKITESSHINFLKHIINSGHESILEHYSISMLVQCDRGVSHELVRHRLASYAQESTRYCNYSKDSFDKSVSFILPCWFSNQDPEHYMDYIHYMKGQPRLDENESVWLHSMRAIEISYLFMLSHGWTPEKARSILPNSLKTEIVMTLNIREWKHFLKLRFIGVSGKVHPQMFEIASKIFTRLYGTFPLLFSDIYEMAKQKELIN